MLCNKAFAGSNETGNAGFHVGCAAPVEFAVAFGGLKRRRCPCFGWAGRNNVGMAGKTHERRTVAVPCPQVLCAAKGHGFDSKANSTQAFGNDLLAAVVIRSNGGLGDKLFG